MAEYKERTRYQASWGAWYVQVQYPTGEIVELKFDHEPKPEMVDKRAQVIADSMAVEKAKPAPAPLVELTVDTAIAYLQEKLVEAKPLEVAKITEFVSAKAVEIKPVEPIVKDPIIKEPVVVK